MRSRTRVATRLEEEITDSRLLEIVRLYDPEIRFASARRRRTIVEYFVVWMGVTVPPLLQALSVSDNDAILVYVAHPGGGLDVALAGYPGEMSAYALARYALADLEDYLLGITTEWGPPRYRRPWPVRRADALAFFDRFLPSLDEQEEDVLMASRRTQRAALRNAGQAAHDTTLARLHQEALYEHGYSTVSSVASPALNAYRRLLIDGHDDAALVGYYRVVGDPISTSDIKEAARLGTRITLLGAMTVVERGVVKVGICDGERLWWGRINARTPVWAFDPAQNYHADLEKAFAEWRLRDTPWPYQTRRLWDEREQALAEVPDPVPRFRDTLDLYGARIAVGVTEFEMDFVDKRDLDLDAIRNRLL